MSAGARDGTRDFVARDHHIIHSRRIKFSGRISDLRLRLQRGITTPPNTIVFDPGGRPYKPPSIRAQRMDGDGHAAAILHHLPMRRVADAADAYILEHEFNLGYSSSTTTTSQVISKVITCFYSLICAITY